MHQQQLTPANVLLQTRIIVGALIAGATMFAAVALYIHFTSGPFVTDDPMLEMPCTKASLRNAALVRAQNFHGEKIIAGKTDALRRFIQE